jgi:oligopeptide transport system ATP-binding protein
MEGVRIAAGTRWNEKEIKWTKIRAKEDIKELEAQKYGLEPGSPELQRLDAQIAEIKANVEKVRKEQMEKIRAAHYDNKHVNEHLAAHEIEVVEKKRKEGLLSEEEYKKELAEARRTTLSHKVQMIFQDPIASLNPRMTVRNIIAEGLIINGVKDKEYIDKEVERVLKLVGLVPEHATRYPHEFSGGQRQRIGIARAIIMKPELIVADEPVSALDVSVQAQVINLLNELRNTLGLTIIFIAHNLSVVKYFCDRIAVMYYGNLVELASSDELFAHPLHPYTKSLLSAVPFPDPIVEKNRTRIIYNPMTDHDYSEQAPTYREIVPGHFVRCNDEEEKKYLEELKK